MKIRYIGARPREIAGPRRLVVQPGEVVDVGDKLGASLLRQKRRFQTVTEPKPEPKVKAETKESSDGNA